MGEYEKLFFLLGREYNDNNNLNIVESILNDDVDISNILLLKIMELFPEYAHRAWEKFVTQRYSVVEIRYILRYIPSLRDVVIPFSSQIINSSGLLLDLMIIDPDKAGDYYKSLLKLNLNDKEKEIAKKIVNNS